jgi:hypothetical protein
MTEEERIVSVLSGMAGRKHSATGGEAVQSAISSRPPGPAAREGCEGPPLTDGQRMALKVFTAVALIFLSGVVFVVTPSLLPAAGSLPQGCDRCTLLGWFIWLPIAASVISFVHACHATCSIARMWPARHAGVVLVAAVICALVSLGVAAFVMLIASMIWGRSFPVVIR